MTIKVRAEVTDADDIRTSLEIECDSQIYGLKLIVVREFSSFLERTLSDCAGRNSMKIRVEVTNEEGATATMEKEGNLCYDELRQLTIKDASRFIEHFGDDSCMSEQLYDSILGALKDVFYEKGYKLLRSRRCHDTGISLFNRIRC